MIVPLPPLDAYRADLASAPGVVTFSAKDGAWLLAAELLRRRATAVRLDPAAEPASIDSLLHPLLPPVDPDTTPVAAGTAAADDRVTRAVLIAAEEMEEGGALQLAYTALAGLAWAAPHATPRSHGLALAQRARVARKLGDLDAAEFLYGEAARVGRRSADADLVVRAAIGKGVVARRRGNYPQARGYFRRALTAATRAGLPALAGLAHHGLLIAAATARDFDTALQHGWAALQLVGDEAGQADLLVSLAAVSSDAGFEAAALRAYLRAAARSRATRLRLPALGGAAVSAARLGHAPLLARITRAVERELARADLPYERAQALTLLAQAWATHAPATAGEPYRSRALTLADAGGFHELAHQGAASSGPGVRVQRATRTVVRALEQLEPAPADDAWLDGEPDGEPDGAPVSRATG